MTLKNYQRAVIGPWNHGASQNASPYQTAESQRVMLNFEYLRFFDHYLKGIDTGLDNKKPLFYFTMRVTTRTRLFAFPRRARQRFPCSQTAVLFPGLSCL